MSWNVIGGLVLLCLGLPMLMCVCMDVSVYVYCWLTGKRMEDYR